MKIIRKIVTHLHPHLDEYLAMFIFLLFGWKRAHFVPNLEYGFIACTGIDTKEFKYSDHLFLGVGGGQFDDHGKQREKSCSQLVCEFLELSQDPRLKILVKQVTIFDKQGASTQNRYNLPEAIKQMHRQGLSDQTVREWVAQAIKTIFEFEAHLYGQIQNEVFESVKSKEARPLEIETRFNSSKRAWFDLSIHKIAKLMGGDKGGKWLKVAMDVFEQQEKQFKRAVDLAATHKRQFKTRFGKKTILAIDGSDGQYVEFEQVLDSASRTARVKADIVLLRNASGHTFIGVNQTARFTLQQFVSLLRQAEADARGEKIPDHLKGLEGEVKGFTQWYVHEGINFTRIYNGTSTRPVVDFSELSFEKIFELLTGWLKAHEIVEQDQKSIATMAQAFESVQ